MHSLVLSLPISASIPLVAFFILRSRLGVSNAGAVAATYGSVKAVTFVAAASYLEAKGTPFSGHMVAGMALMEAPAIIVGVILIRKFSQITGRAEAHLSHLIAHIFTNDSVLLILGSIFIGLIADSKQLKASGPSPRTSSRDSWRCFCWRWGWSPRNGSAAALTPECSCPCLSSRLRSSSGH